MPHRRHRPVQLRAPSVATGLAVLAVLVAGCDLPSAEQETVVVTTDDRVVEVRAAREAVAAPVPALVAEAERLVDALEQVWTEEASSDRRAALADALQLGPLQDAVATLDAVELEGDGPDVLAAAAVLDDLVRDGRGLLEAADEELASVAGPSPFDDQLADLLVGWDARGSYSQQLTAFEELARAAEELAAVADGRSAVPTCVQLWPRRSEAASVVAARTRELRTLIRDRRGQEFDDLRDAYRQDPYGTGDLLGVLDARAAAACWADASAAPAVLTSLTSHVTALGAALDPPDLQG